jgi:hypothetical protein
MVKVTALILASVALAPLAFATETLAESGTPPAARAVEEPTLEARAPAPQPFGKWLGKIARNRWVRKAIPYAATAAKLILRDEEGNVYVRDVDLSELDERDFDEFDMAALDARDFDDLEELEMREPRRKKKKSLEARDFEDYDDLEAREPRRRGFGRALGKVRGLAKKASGLAKYAKFVNPAAGTALSLLGSREFDEDELDARDYEDLMDLLEEREFYDDEFELDARDPWFGDRIWKKAKQVRQKGSGVLNQVNDANKWLGNVGLRELGDELDERSYDNDLDALD